MFNCSHPESPCVYFELGKFLEQQNITLNQTWRSMNPNLPAITSLRWSTRNVMAATQASWMHIPANVSFIHIHKCGGSSVKAIFQALRKQWSRRNPNLDVHVNTYQSSFGSSNLQQRLRNEHERQIHIESLSLHPSQQVVFTIVRDPVDRFISAVQQVMHYHHDLRKACLLPSATRTIECAMTYMETQAANDVHLVPMLSHLRLLHGVKLRVFQLEHLHVLSNYFTNRTIRVRDRSDSETATSLVLANMSASDCTQDMLQKICEMYAVDVAMMHSMGLSTKYCD
ncbi:hypothetical protein MPSEU_000072800 [Mayamaea pseudoterrestris]|nr:hypothetical protein MPSEU_000072800 [Mayamaea pseudoterrestris]